MIKVEKSILPDHILTKLEKHGQEYLAAQASNDEKKANNIKKKYSLVKEFLVADFNGKCAYCESKIRHISAGQTDHVVPVSKDPQLIFNWDNLVLACEICNRNKSDYSNEDLALVNPLVDDPTNHLYFHGPLIEEHDERGEATISQLKLDREELLLVRAERIKKLTDTIRRIATVSTSMKSLLLKDLLSEGESSKEFSLMVNTYVRFKLLKLGIAS